MAKDEKEYQGPGKFTAAVGRGATEYVAGGIVGAAAGAAVGAVTHSRKASKQAMTETERTVSKMFSLSSGTGIGGLIGSIVGLIHGAYKGAHNVTRARDQVNSLNAQVDALGGQLSQQKSFVDTLVKERHAAAEAAQVPEGKTR